MFSNLFVTILRCVYLFVTQTATALADTVSLTPAQVLGGLIVGTPTAAANYTLPTAAAILDAMGGSGQAKVGDSFEFYIRNVSAGAYTITLVTGTGITLAAGNTNTAVQANTRSFMGIVTGTVTPAITIYSMCASAH